MILFSPSRHFGTETLFCDCQLRWLLLWARSISVRIGNDTACVYPARLHGLEFRNLHEQQLTCGEDSCARATGALCLLLLTVQGYWSLSVKAELRSGCILEVSLFSLNARRRKFWSTCWDFSFFMLNDTIRRTIHDAIWCWPSQLLFIKHHHIIISVLCYDTWLNGWLMDWLTFCKKIKKKYVYVYIHILKK